KRPSRFGIRARARHASRFHPRPRELDRKAIVRARFSASPSYCGSAHCSDVACCAFAEFRVVLVAQLSAPKLPRRERDAPIQTRLPRALRPKPGSPRIPFAKIPVDLREAFTRGPCQGTRFSQA